MGRINDLYNDGIPSRRQNSNIVALMWQVWSHSFFQSMIIEGLECGAVQQIQKFAKTVDPRASGFCRLQRRNGAIVIFFEELFKEMGKYGFNADDHNDTLCSLAKCPNEYQANCLTANLFEAALYWLASYHDKVKKSASRPMAKVISIRRN